MIEDVGLPHPRPPATPARPEGDLDFDFDWAVVEQVRPEIDQPAAHWPETLARIDVPTLAISGGPQSFLPQEHIAELVALVQRGRHVTIDAGHSIHASSRKSSWPRCAPSSTREQRPERPKLTACSASEQALRRL